MTIKQDRMAERIQIVLSQLLMREVSDPRLQSVTVTHVQVDAEIMHAKVFVNALGDEEREQEVMQGLDRAGGFLRRELAQRIQTRTVPELHFKWDKTLRQADRVESILDSLDIPATVDDDDNDELELNLDDVDLDGPAGYSEDPTAQ